MAEAVEETRVREWFVPKRGPRRLRLLIGLSFFPYTLMNASYVAIGSLLAPSVHYDRLAILLVVYVLAVGIGAHSLDALGPSRPWGRILTTRQLKWLAAAGLTPALALGLYLSLSYSTSLLVVGTAELFFLLAYNLEPFRGEFHTDFWFALSWGFLPVIAGYVVQGGTPGLAAGAGGVFGFSTAYLEITASRPYKSMKKDPVLGSSELAHRLERVLETVVFSVVLAALFLLALRAG